MSDLSTYKQVLIDETWGANAESRIMQGLEPRFNADDTEVVPHRGGNGIEGGPTSM